MRISDLSSDVCSSDLEVIETNILGFTDLLARLVEIFKRQQSESSIIAVSSLAGETSVPFQAVYGASKAYVSNLMRALSVRSEEHTSELQSLMRISYAVFCLKKKKNKSTRTHITQR